jgi:hypothetical protein
MKFQPDLNGKRYLVRRWSQGGFLSLVGSWNYWKCGLNFQGNRIHRHEAEPVDELGAKILYYILGEFDLVELPPTFEENEIECAVEFMREAPNRNIGKNYPPPPEPHKGWNQHSGLAYWQSKHRAFTKEEIIIVWNKYQEPFKQ